MSHTCLIWHELVDDILAKRRQCRQNLRFYLLGSAVFKQAAAPLRHVLFLAEHRSCVAGRELCAAAVESGVVYKQRIRQQPQWSRSFGGLRRESPPLPDNRRFDGFILLIFFVFFVLDGAGCGAFRASTPARETFLRAIYVLLYHFSLLNPQSWRRYYWCSVR